uniref:Uncharacterized protein n=1 Tax=Lygus hesperus TaxID=30085 RepID=A0A0A9WFY6_LYGHE
MRDEAARLGVREARYSAFPVTIADSATTVDFTNVSACDDREINRNKSTTADVADKVYKVNSSNTNNNNTSVKEKIELRSSVSDVNHMVLDQHNSINEQKGAQQSNANAQGALSLSTVLPIKRFVAEDT